MSDLKLASVDEQYKKFPEVQKSEVVKLQEWVKKQPYLPEMTELEVIIFYHSCKCSSEATKACIDTYYTLRTHCTDFFGNRNVLGKDMVNAMDLMMYVPLPGLTPEGYKIIYCKIMNPDPSTYNLAESIKLFSMVADLWLLEEGIAEGHIIVADMNGMGFGHLARLGILTVKKVMFYLQEALPVRLKGLHFVNTVPFMDKILALMRPFMKKELMDVLSLHSNLDTFYKFAPKDMLPLECGGTAGSFQELREKGFQHIKNNKEYFLEEEKTRRVNEKLRPGKSKIASDVLGLEGNFKKLDID